MSRPSRSGNPLPRAYPSEAVPSSLLLHIALSHYERGDLEKAMEALTEARQGAPHSADIQYYMGQCEFGWRDYIRIVLPVIHHVAILVDDNIRNLPQVQTPARR